jgi:hypothetical protein
MSRSRVEQTLAPRGAPDRKWTRAALALVMTAALVAVAGIGSGRSLVRVGGPRRVLDVASFSSDALVVAAVVSPSSSTGSGDGAGRRQRTLPLA